MSNLSEEERKKAYEFLQELDKNGYRYTADGREMYIVENVFNKIDRLQKENEELKDYKEYNEVWAGKYHLLSRKINGVLEDKIKDKIKELEELFDKNEKEITIQYQNQFIVDVVGILEDLLKEN